MAEEQFSYFIGLDIGTIAVRCVVGELSGDAALPKIIGFSSAENSGMRKGNIAHAEEVVQAVTAAVNEAERMSGREIKRLPSMLMAGTYKELARKVSSLSAPRIVR